MINPPFQRLGNSLAILLSFVLGTASFGLYPEFAFGQAHADFSVLTDQLPRNIQPQDDSETADQGTPATIPDDWKRGSGEGFVVYDCWVMLPNEWQDQEIEVFLEPGDDARELLVNGKSISRLGSFPPNYRSGLGETKRFLIPSANLDWAKVNRFTIRIYQRASRENFNIAPPAIVSGEQAIRLQGEWLKRTGEAVAFQIDEDRKEQFRFQQVEPAEVVKQTWQRLQGDAGPQSPEDSLATMKTGPGLAVDLVLSDPSIGQPLSVKFDERGRLWVAEYLQYPNPAGLKMLSRDKFLRSVYDKVPPPPPHHDRGADRISIHEDSNGDGVFDKHSIFVDGLNMMTSFEFAKDGLFVLNPPYLLWYADQDDDGQADGDPEVLLEGFGLEDSHSIANSLRWGPDGWLYGVQGSTVSADIRRYGSEEEPLHTVGQLVWRYHPKSEKFEVFAEGGGNAFGLELDRAGRLFSGHNGGDTRGFHYVQGGYFQKSFGKHGSLSNPYAFGYFPWMKHHSAERFSHTFVIDTIGLLGEQYESCLFAVEPLQGRVMVSRITRDGSTFKTEDLFPALNAGDTWFRPVDIQLGPDGSLYIADFYEQRIDHSSHYQGRVHKESGRIYRLRDQNKKPFTVDFDFSSPTKENVARALVHRNRWVRQTALRMVMENEQLQDVDFWGMQLADDRRDDAVGYFWAQFNSGELSSSDWKIALQHPSAQVRKWAVRLLCENGPITDVTYPILLQITKSETDVEVQSQLASSATYLAKREPQSTVGLVWLKELATHSQDLQDPHLPLLIWWGIEAHAAKHPEAIVAMVADDSWRRLPIPSEVLLPRIMRRYATSGTLRDWDVCEDLFLAVNDEASAKQLLQGFEQAFENRLIPKLPASLAEQLLKHKKDSLDLRLQLGEKNALEEVLNQLRDGTGSVQQRLRWLPIIAQAKDDRLLPTLTHLVRHDESEAIRLAAVQALQFVDKPEVARQLIEVHSDSNAAVQDAIEMVLSSRRGWATELLDALVSKRIDASEVATAAIDRLSLYPNDEIRSKMNSLWPTPEGDTQQTLAEKLDYYQQQLAAGSGSPHKGRELFLENCGRCHKLFEDGGDIGPDLTSYKRTDLQGILTHVIQPSLEIREGYETTVVFTLDGLAVTGFVADEDANRIVLTQADGQQVTIELDDIDDRQRISKSIMPDGLLNTLDEQQVRDLFAYLRSSQPLPD